MSLAADHKALVFLAAVAILGAGVRMVRASRQNGAAAAQPALDHQLSVADSASRARRRGPQSRTKGKARRTPESGRAESAAAVARPPEPMGRDYPGYGFGKLDLDVATRAQIESLPGIGPAMARRIVADRAAHGPFVDKQGFRRVPGAGPALLRRLDTLVTFSGTMRLLNADAESSSAHPSRRRRPKKP